MRRFAITAALAIAASLGITAVAQAANTYQVNIARITPQNAGTSTNPKPARVGFGYRVGTDDGNRPAVTTDYIIGVGPGIRSTWSLRDARTRRAVWPKCPQRRAINNACPSNTKLGGGVVNNQAGPTGDPSTKIPCRLNLDVFIGDGRLFPPAQNDGKRVRAHLWLALKSVPGLCPLTVDAAIPVQLVRYRRGTALSFHVPRNPFQQPVPGVDNAVTDVTASVFKSRTRVNTRVGTRTVRRTRGFFEAINCFARRHRVQVQFTSTTGQRTTAGRNSRCVK